MPEDLKLDWVERGLLSHLIREVLIVPPMPVLNLNDEATLAVDFSLAPRLHQDRRCKI